MGNNHEWRADARLRGARTRGSELPLTALILDANAFATTTTRGDGLKVFADEELIAPPLLWSETRSVLHVATWRGLISADTAEAALNLLESGRVRERKHRRLGREAWRIADELGWAKTYDAEYLALASLIDVPIMTLDRRMKRAAESLGLTVAPLPG